LKSLFRKRAMRTLKILTSKDESLVNKIIREKKKSSFTIFYHSEWDIWSNKVLENAKAWVERDGKETCYVVSSWELPHVFSAFGITSAPAIVKVDKGNTKVFVEYPKVHAFFDIPKPRRKKAAKKKAPRNPE